MNTAFHHPSYGHEMLRFERILSEAATLPECGLGTPQSVTPELAGARRRRAWAHAASFADHPPVVKRWEHGIYCGESFGQVAATVNFGSQTRDTSKIAKVNGIAARVQAYTNALIVLCEGVGFPNDKKEVKDVPNGFKRR